MPPTKKTPKSATKKPAPKKAAPSDKKELKTAAAEDKPAKKKATARPAVKKRPLVDSTFFAKPGDVPSRWRLLDAEGQTLGRLSTYIACALMGKDRPTYTRSADTGDFVVVINAEKVVLTGKKWSQKTYYHHTGYAGGIKAQTADYVREHHPERLIEKAVWRMLPKGHMGRKWFSKLKVYAGTQHPHQAQQPEKISLAKSV